MKTGVNRTYKRLGRIITSDNVFLFVFIIATTLILVWFFEAGSSKSASHLVVDNRAVGVNRGEGAQAGEKEVSGEVVGPSKDQFKQNAGDSTHSTSGTGPRSDGRSNVATDASPAPKASPSSFRITKVVLLDPIVQCGAGYRYLVIDDVLVMSNSDAGGKFTWQFEIKGEQRPGTNSVTYPTTAVMPKGQNYVYLKRETADPSNMLIVQYRYKEALRVHVTAPNSVVSPWFTITPDNSKHCGDFPPPGTVQI